MTYSGSKPPISRSRAWVCAVINQLVFPGAGTMMAGNKRVGIMQLVLTIIGGLLFGGFMVCFFLSMVQYLQAPDAGQFGNEFGRYAWAGWLGVGLSLAGWFWALVSSLQILYESVPGGPQR